MRIGILLLFAGLCAGAASPPDPRMDGSLFETRRRPLGGGPAFEPESRERGQSYSLGVVDPTGRKSGDHLVDGGTAERLQMKSLLNPHSAPGKTDQKDNAAVGPLPAVEDGRFAGRRRQQGIGAERCIFSRFPGDVPAFPFGSPAQACRCWILGPTVEAFPARPARNPEAATAQHDFSATRPFRHLRSRQTVAYWQN